MAAGSTDPLIQDSTLLSLQSFGSSSFLSLPSLRFRPCAAASVLMSDLLVRSVSLHFTPRVTKWVKPFSESESWCQILFKMYLKSPVTFQTCHSTSVAQSLLLQETCCKCAASVLPVCILCASDRVRSVLTFLTTIAAGTLKVCRVCMLQLQPENHPSIQNSSRR